MATPTKTLRDLRTLSGKVDRTSLPYRAYMKITCLEMEKARRGGERRSANQRIADIDARLRDIEAEKAALLRSLEAKAGGRIVAGLELKPAPRTAGRGFRLRY